MSAVFFCVGKIEKLKSFLLSAIWKLDQRFRMAYASTVRHFDFECHLNIQFVSQSKECISGHYMTVLMKWFGFTVTSIIIVIRCMYVRLFDEMWQWKEEFN